MDEESSSSDMLTVNPNLDQETVVDTCQVDVNLENSCVMNVNFAKNISSDVNGEVLDETGDNVNSTLDTLSRMPTVKFDSPKNANREMENDNNISDNTVQENPNNRMSFSQNSESNVTLSPRWSFMDVIRTHCHKVPLVLAVCSIIALCAMPLIFYYVVNQTRDNTTTDLVNSHGENINTKVSHTCVTINHGRR